MTRKKGGDSVSVDVKEPEQKQVGGFEVPGTTLMNPSRLNPAPYNPKTITPERLESLKHDIRRFGFVEKMVVQRSSPRHGEFVIVGGHQRMRAVREICIEDNVAMPDVPCTVLDLTDRQAKMLNAALNTPRGEFDNKLLGEMLESIHHESPILPEERIAMGFDDEELGKLLKLADPPVLSTPEPAGFARSVTLSLEFQDVRERDAVKAKLVERAEMEKKKTGEIVHSLLMKRR